MANQEVVRAWAAALRSGKYQQGRNNLCTIATDGTRRYCCLGVLAELAVEAGVIEAVDAYGLRSFGGKTGLPPVEVEEWAGIKSWYVTDPVRDYRPGCLCESCVPPRGNGVGLAALNDEHLEDFHGIAELIEKEWLAA